MINPKNIIADMHTHTIASGHAFSTLFENTRFAAANHLDFMAVTDHYFCDPSSKFSQLNEVYRMASANKCNAHGITVINGGEFNLEHTAVWDYKDILKNVKWRLIGLHDWFFKHDMSTINLIDLRIIIEGHINLLDNWGLRPTAIAHIERDLQKFDKYSEKYFRAFMEHILTLTKNMDIFMEVNEGSLKYKGTGNEERMKIWIAMAKENGNKICLGTDAHFCTEVGYFDGVIDLLDEVDYPEELILNCNEEWLMKYV